MQYMHILDMHARADLHGHVVFMLGTTILGSPLSRHSHVMAVFRCVGAR